MKLRLALLSCVLLASACVDNGNKIERVRFTSATVFTTPLTEPVAVYQCFPQTLTLIGEFTDGSLGNFTQRGAVYTSSDTSKVRVSNADIDLPDGSGKYARGVVIPGDVTTEPVTITAEYVGYTASMQVTVAAPGQVTVLPTSPVSSSTNPYAAPGSVLGLRALADFNGATSNVTGLGQWTFDNADDTIATLGQFTGVVSAIAPGTLTARYSLPACPSSATSITANASIPVTVAALDHIEISREFPGQPLLTSPTSPLFTTDAISTTGVFAGGEKQDLTFQSTLTLTPADSKSVVLRSGNLLTALQQFDTSVTPSVPFDPVTVTASFTSPATTGTTFTATSEAVSAKEALLQSISIPGDQQNAVIAPFATLQYHAIGNFTDSAGATYTQDITRHVGWTSSDTTVAVLGNIYGSISSANGLATSLKNAAGCVTVSATTTISDGSTTGGTLGASTLLAVSPATQPCTPTTTPTS